MRSFRRRKKTTDRTKHQPSNILILTGSIGSGHVSAARAITQAIYRMNGSHFNVETVDFITALANFATSATKKIYLGSLKLSPKIYELIFSHSSEQEWPLKLLNLMSAPFIQQKFRELMEEKCPRVLVSTFPIWDILIKKTWKEYCRREHLPFVSVVTDSISIHNAWTLGEPDYFVVPNEDTSIALQNRGVPVKKIRVLGYPVSHRFLKHPDCADFQRKWDLSPKRKTLLLVLSVGVSWSKVKQLITAMKRSKLKKIQLVIIAGGDEGWTKKLSNIAWPWPTRVTGWTNEMHSFIHGSDIVLTKAGGATTMECISSQKPMIIVDAIPGQEIGNAMLVQKYNLGVVLNRDASDFDRAVEYILSHEELIKKNLAAQQKPHAAEDIAKFLLSLVK